MDKLGDFTPVCIFKTNKIFFELRGVDDPSILAVELCVPSIEAPLGLTEMIEVLHDQIVKKGLQLVLTKDIIATRCSYLMFAFHLYYIKKEYYKQDCVRSLIC